MNIKLSKLELLGIVDDYIEAQSMALSPFFPEVIETIRGDYFRSLVENCYNLVTLREWDYDLDLQEAETNLHLFIDEGSYLIKEQCEFVEKEFELHVKLEFLTELFTQAQKIISRWEDQSSPWTVEELQFFCDLSHQSIINSKNSSGSDSLEFDSGGTVGYEVGIEWLRGRKSYKGLEESLSSSLISRFSFTQYYSLGLFVRSRLARMNIPIESIGVKLQDVLIKNNWNCIEPSLIFEISSLLRFEPIAFFEQLQKVIENESRQAFEVQIKARSIKLDENEPATADAIKKIITGQPDKFIRHPKNKPSNTKIGIFYCNKNNVTFAHEFNLKNNQHIWVRKSDLPQDFLNQVLAGQLNDVLKFTDKYPDASDKLNSTIGRHSGLLLSDELKDSELIKLTPITMKGVYRIFEIICLI